MPGWRGSDRRTQLPNDWGVTTLRILTRDFHRCQWVRVDTGTRCLAPNSHDVDHIIRPDDGGTDEDSNLQTLCFFHHQRKSSYEGGKASGVSRRAAADRKKSQRPPHPGLMPAPTREDPAPF
jgi:5-methylcytosine-specific restriction protein A